MSTDTDTVPMWPCPVIALTPEGAATVDGEVVEPPGLDESAARAAALETVRQRYAAMRRPVRVQAHDPDGTVWLLALNPDGTWRTLDEPATTPPDSGSKRRRGAAPARRPARPPRPARPVRPGRRQTTSIPMPVRIGAAGVGATLLIALVTFAVHTRPGQAEGATQSGTAEAAAPPPANLPLPAPDGFSTRASWALPVNPSVAPLVTDKGVVAVVTEDGDLDVLDASTGRRLWSRSLPLGAYGSLHATTIDGHPVIALASDSSLTYWRLDDAAHRQLRVDIPASAHLSFRGLSPLVELPDQTAGVVAGDKVVTLDVPVGATALSADNGVVTAVASAGEVWTLQAQQSAAETAHLVGPGGAQIVSAVTLGDHQVLAVWKLQEQDSSPTATLSAADGSTRASLTLPNVGIDLKEAVTNDARDVLAVGPLVVDAREGRLRLADAQLTTKAVTGSDVWAVGADQSLVHINGTTGSSGDPKTAIPLGITADHAFVTAEKLDDDQLYALPRG